MKPSAHLWIPEMSAWTARVLNDDVSPLPGTSPSTPSGAVIRRTAPGAHGSAWHLLSPPTLAVRINGEPVQLGIRALRDKDEIRLPGAAPMFFSTEQLVAVEPFTGAQDGKCPRCSKAIKPLSPAVRCHGCQMWYHQEETRQCFTYGESPICVVCGADAVVSDAFTWSPEEL